MKKAGFILFLLIIGNTLFAEPHAVEDGVAGWGPENGSMGEYLSFKDGIYRFDMQGPGGMTCDGKYSIAGRKIFLKQGSTNHKCEQCSDAIGTWDRL